MGVGVVFNEWASVLTLSNGFAKLAPLLLMSADNTQGGSAMTFTLLVPNHPIWNGLPSSFTTNVGLGSVVSSTVIHGGTQIASAQFGIGVAALDPNEGRVVHLAYSANWGNAAWYFDPNLTTLVANSALWSARCQ